MVKVGWEQLAVSQSILNRDESVCELGFELSAFLAQAPRYYAGQRTSCPPLATVEYEDVSSAM